MRAASAGSRAVVLLLAAAWTGFIFYFGTAPSMPGAPDLLGDWASYLAHYGTHLVLAALVYLLVSPHTPDSGPKVRAAITAISVTIAIGIGLEFVQALFPNRSPQASDVLVNALGAATGAALVFVPDYLGVSRALLIAGAAGATLVSMAAISANAVISPPSPFPQVLDCNSLPPEAYQANGLRGRQPGFVELSQQGDNRVRGGLVALYRFEEGQGTVAHDTSGIEPALDLHIKEPSGVRWLEGGGVEFFGPESAIVSQSTGAKIFGRLAATHVLTLEAWVAPANLAGEARILALSGGEQHYEFNFRMGQDEADLIFTLRTMCDAHGQVRERNVFSRPGVLHHVVVTYDGETRNVFVDGVPEKSNETLQGDLANWDPNYPLIIGNSASSEHPFAGQVLLVAIYDRPLSEQEAQQNFMAGP